jgi:hypothetical protein
MNIDKRDRLMNEQRKESSMREIKFRGWWRHRDGSAHELIEDINDRPISDLNEAYFIIEQFTGLHDKNGKEIYEGDVVDYFIHKYRVGFHNGTFGLFSFNHTGFTPFFDSVELRCEVIGNIYEDKHLIE